MINLLYKLSIKFLKWNLRRMEAYNIESIIRADGMTIYKRNREKEKGIKRTLDLITLNNRYVPTFKYSHIDKQNESGNGYLDNTGEDDDI